MYLKAKGQRFVFTHHFWFFVTVLQLHFFLKIFSIDSDVVVIAHAINLTPINGLGKSFLCKIMNEAPICPMVVVW